MITDDDLLVELESMLEGSPGSSSFSIAGVTDVAYPCVVLREVIEDDTGRLVNNTVMVASTEVAGLEKGAQIVVTTGSYAGTYRVGPDYSGHPSEYKTVLERLE